jgi:glycosyltransferase involved in cell wall biosynthesis
LYLNEGGHIRFVKLLARLLPNKHFFMHIRLLEDCSSDRLNNLSKNIHLLTVSEYLKAQIPNHFLPKVIYDPYTLEQKEIFSKSERSNFTIGVVGRVTQTKGLDSLLPILKLLSKTTKQTIHLHFYGSSSDSEKWLLGFKKEIIRIPNIKTDFIGFVSNKERIYNNIDLLLHVNKVEALGRVLFETVDYNTPFLTFDEGGCGELAKQLKLDELLVQDKAGWEYEFAHKITHIIDNENAFSNQLKVAKEIIRQDFNSDKYTQRLEAFFMDSSSSLI